MNLVSLPIFSGLISLPCNDSDLNGLANIDEKVLLQIRQYLTTDISNSEFQPGKKAFYLENDELKIKRIIKI